MVFGRDTGFDAALELSALDGSNGFVLNGIDERDSSGGSVSGAGDINGDGIDDLIIGATADPNGRDSARAMWCLAAIRALTQRWSFLTLDGSNGFVLNGIDADDRSGVSVSGAGDINGDGIDDLIIGAYGPTPTVATFRRELRGVWPRYGL